MAPRGTVDDLAALFRGRTLAVLTGAGCSTESGIPDYRGPGTRARARNPIQGQMFRKDPSVRARYWARSLLGWPRFSTAAPNDGHRALAAMEAQGRAVGLITQNVDRLHQAAGSRDVVELHGALADVHCLECDAHEPRAALQSRLEAMNPGFGEHLAAMAPDGDADLDADVLANFRVPACLHCSGALKPRVVFFGENVPKPTVERAFALVDRAEALLIVGTSLAIYSGLRFVRRAAERNIPVGMVNLGPTRGDPMVHLHIDAPAGVALPALLHAL